MNIREAVHKHLTSDTGVVALVSDRVYLAAAPQKPRVPLIVFSVDAGVRDHTQDGASGIVLGRFKIDCLATSAKDAGDVADAVNAALSGFRGVMGGVGGVQVDAAFMDNESDWYHDELQLHIVTLDVSTVHHED